MLDEPVIWFDSSPNDLEVIIVFSRDENFAALTQCNIIFADGTFKIASDLFEQLCTVYGLHRNSTVLPFVCALLLRKTAAMYQRVLELIDDYINEHCTIIINFEQAKINAFRQSFTFATIH
jgi:hypothetical protein